MAKLSYLSASETRALLCKYFDKVCSVTSLSLNCFYRFLTYVSVGSVVTLDTIKINTNHSKSQMFCVGGVSARGRAQAAACPGRAGNATR